MRLVRALALIALPLTAVPAAAQTVSFDDVAAPCLFSATAPLTTQYSGLGLTFSGGGAILGECGAFGISARSGTQFLAYNTGGYAVGPLQIAFASPVTTFSIFAGSGQSTSFLLQAFGANDALLGGASVSPAAGAWSELAFASGQGIARVTVTTTASAYVFDDLTVGTSVVPEPGTFALVGGGLAIAAFAARRRRAVE